MIRKKKRRLFPLTLIFLNNLYSATSTSNISSTVPFTSQKNNNKKNMQLPKERLEMLESRTAKGSLRKSTPQRSAGVREERCDVTTPHVGTGRDEDDEQKDILKKKKKKTTTTIIIPISEKKRYLGQDQWLHEVHRWRARRRVSAADVEGTMQVVHWSRDTRKAKGRGNKI